MSMPKNAKAIAIAVLLNPEFHWNACREDVSGRPKELDCACPIKEIIQSIIRSEEK
jgi:hypothetical protein